MQKLRAGGTLALACGLIVGCGGGNDEDPADVLRTALSADPSYDSGVINLGFNGSLEGETSGSLEASISGPFTSGGEGGMPEVALDATADVSAENLPDVPGGSVSFNFDGGFGLADETLFVTYNDTTYAASEELYSQVAPIVEIASQADDAATESDPDEFINSLSNLENEGTEEIGGEETVHVSGDLDFAALAESGATEAAGVDSAVFEGLSSSADFYVSEEDDSVRQVDLNFSADGVEQLAAQGIDGLDFTISVGISEPGSEQDVTAPTDTEPLDDLLAQFGTSEDALLQGLSGSIAGAGQFGGLTPGGSGIEDGGAALPADPSDPKFQKCVEDAGNDPSALADCFE